MVLFPFVDGGVNTYPIWIPKTNQILGATDEPYQIPSSKLTWQWTNTMSNKRIHSNIFFHCYRTLPVLPDCINNFPMNFATIFAPRNLQEVHQSNQVHWDKVKFVSTAPRNTCPAPDVPRFFWQNSQRPNWMNLEKSWFLGNKDPTNTMVY